MILTRQERERLVLNLCYNQGKNTREISQVGMSFRDIGAILKKAQKEKESEEERTQQKCVYQQAYKLFPIVNLQYKYPLH